MKVKLTRTTKGYQTTDVHGRFQITDMLPAYRSVNINARVRGPRWLVFDLFTGRSFKEHTLQDVRDRIIRRMEFKV